MNQPVRYTAGLSAVATIGAVGILLSLAAGLQIRNMETREAVSDFEHVASDRASVFREDIENRLLMLESIRNFYLGSEEVTHEGFQVFVSSFLSQGAGTQALQWVPRVSDSHRTVFEASGHADTSLPFEITQRDPQGRVVRADRRHEYFPVLLTEPHQENLEALGLDLASDPSCLEAIQLARDTERTTATEPLTVERDQEEFAAVLLFQPVYREVAALGAAEDHEKELRGFVVAVLRVHDVLEGALARLHEAGVDVTLRDESVVGEGRLVCFRAATARETPRKGDFHREQGLQYETTHCVGQRRWTLVMTPTPEFLATHRTWRPLGVLFSGLAFTGLLGVYSLSIIGRTARIQRLVNQRTQELQASEASLVEQSDHLSQRTVALRQAQVRLAGFAEFAAALNQTDADTTYEETLKVIQQRTEVPLVSLFGRSETEAMECKCVFSLDHRVLDSHHFAPGGLPATVAETGKTVVISGPFKAPELTLGIGMGEMEILRIVGWPILFQGHVVGVLLTVLVKPLTDEQDCFIETSLQQLAVRMKTFQAEEQRAQLMRTVQSRSTSLRVSNNAEEVST